MYWRIYIGKIPFVGRNLPVGMHVPLVEEEEQLVFGKFRIQTGQRNAVEGQVPGSIPGVLPLVRHGNDVKILEVCPAVISTFFALLWRLISSRISFKPAVDIVVVKLFGPKQPGVSLALDVLMLCV